MREEDNLNRLFISSKTEDVINFYSKFDKLQDLLNWSRNRPYRKAKIYESNKTAKNDIIIVIPVIDHKSEHALNCKNSIFKDTHIIFVESGAGDSYFNYARNCNIGLKYALKYNPKWIILSNDDVYKIDDITILKNELHKLSKENCEAIFIKPEPDYYHSYRISLVKRTALSKIYRSLSKSRRIEERLLDKFKVKYSAIPTGINFKTFFLRVVYYPVLLNFINIGDFVIFNAKFIKKKHGKVFDEMFISGWEDVDLSIKLVAIKIVNFRIGSKRGKSLGQNNTRNLRNIINKLYFGIKASSYLKQRR